MPAIPFSSSAGQARYLMDTKAQHLQQESQVFMPGFVKFYSFFSHTRCASFREALDIK